tara:strand:- start:1179 stop:2357 length:1179 start_codon:yes stop_codon:yes gene_type:complete
MDNFNILSNENIQTINLDLNNMNDNSDIGIEMLVNSDKNINTGNSKPENINKEDINLFNDTAINDDNKNISFGNDILPNDPILSRNDENDDENSEFKPIFKMSPQDIKNEKIDLIYKFKRLENQGIKATMNYNMNSQLDDMRNEYIKLKKQRETENAIKFQRKMLMACITGIEFMNGKFDPFSVKLDGWSESMNEGIDDYDEVFEELHDKYGGKGEMAPEIRLIFMIAGSAFMFHLTNTMFKTSLPGMDDILKQNPELMQQFASAALNTPKSDHTQKPSNPTTRDTRPPPQPMGGPLGSMMGGLMNNIMGGPPSGGNNIGGDPISNMMGGLMGGMMGGPQSKPQRNKPKPKSDIDDIDNIINNMNIDPSNIDLDSISIISGDSDNGGLTLNI